LKIPRGVGSTASAGVYTDGPVAGKEGRMTVMGTEGIGIYNSSSSDDIGSRWLGFSHLVCFSEFRWYFSTFIPSINRIVWWKMSRDGTTTAVDVVGGVWSGTVSESSESDAGLYRLCGLILGGGSC